MKIFRCFVTSLLLCMAFAFDTMAADLKVDLATSLSGPASSLGIPYEKGLRAGPAYKPVIGGRKVHLIAAGLSHRQRHAG